MTHAVGKQAPSSQHLNQLGQYASSTGYRGVLLCRTRHFFPSVGRSHR